MSTPQPNPSFNNSGGRQLHWGIVGGGMLGLTLAHKLAQQGQRVTLLEAAAEIGGLAGAWQLGEVVWDRHYHVTLLSDLRLRNLLDELGLESDMQWVETKTGFYTDGKLYSMSNTMEFLRFPPLNFLEKLRLGGTIFLASKIRNWQKLEKVLVADWLRKWSGNGAFQKMWLPLLQAKLGQTYRRVSASFIWATIARMYRARQTGMKKEMFGYVPGGYARILKRFADHLVSAGVDLKTSHGVQSVVSDLGTGCVEIDCGENGKLEFDRVVLTTPSGTIAKLCPQLDDDQRSKHQQIEYLGILCASLVLKRPLAEFYVTNITDSWVPFTAVIEMTTLVEPQELGDRHLVYLPKYVAADDPAWNFSDTQIEADFVAALERMYPDFRREDIEAFHVSRVKNVMALPTLEYSQQLPPMRTSVPSVLAINSAHIVKGTLNVNEVVELAEDAFREYILPDLQKANGSNRHLNATREKHGQTAGELVARPG